MVAILDVVLTGGLSYWVRRGWPLALPFGRRIGWCHPSGDAQFAHQPGQSAALRFSSWSSCRSKSESLSAIAHR